MKRLRKKPERWLPDSYTVLDIETSGFGKNDKVLEVAAVRVQGQKIVDSFYSLVDVGVGIRERAAAVHGLKPEDLLGAPTWDELREPLVDFVDAGGSCWVSHNASFDRRLLGQSMGLEVPEGVCSLQWARQHLELDSYGLPEIVKYAGGVWDEGQAHGAAYDCLMLALALISIGKE